MVCRIKPVDLWYLARTETNKHISELDFLNPVPIYDINGTYQGIIDYNRLYDPSSQSFFDFNLRKKLGLAINGTEWIDIDSYAPETFSLDMFSADELLNNGKSYIEYAGYDYTGKKLGSQPSLDDFFNQKDVYGNNTRVIGAFNPIYRTAYIQYTFTGKKINAQIGVRGDFYNANQMKLKDPYLLYEARTAKTVTNLGGHPDNIGENYVVYVNDAHNPTSIVGYRDLGNWYNAAGTKIEDPALLETPSGIAPYLLNPHQTQINSSPFEIYKTVFNFLPSFSINYDFFPKYQLFGSYQANTQNPNRYCQLRPDQYFFIENQDYILNNPALKPEKVVKAKIGVKRMFFSSFLAVASFNYINIENKVLLKYYYEAYPCSYYTYANTNKNFVRNTLDFSIKYYKPGEKEINIGIYYSLLFKSKDSIHFTPFTKHIANSFINYRFNKKVIIDNQIIQRPVFGISLIHHFRSKTDYSDYLYEYELPIFQYFDVKIEKPFYFGKNFSTSAFVMVQNIFNTKNIFSVYPNTNKPDNDGFLNAPGSQALIQQQTNEQSFRDLYAVNMNNPNFYDTPRMLIFGIRFGL